MSVHVPSLFAFSDYIHLHNGQIAKSEAILCGRTSILSKWKKRMNCWHKYICQTKGINTSLENVRMKSRRILSHASLIPLGSTISSSNSIRCLTLPKPGTWNGRLTLVRQPAVVASPRLVLKKETSSFLSKDCFSYRTRIVWWPQR